MIAPLRFSDDPLSLAGCLSRFVPQRQFDMRLGGFGRFFQTQFDLLLFAQQIAPVAFFIPLAPVQFDGVLDALAAVAALQIVFAAIFVAPPADALGVFGEYGGIFSP